MYLGNCAKRSSDLIIIINNYVSQYINSLFQEIWKGLLVFTILLSVLGRTESVGMSIIIIKKVLGKKNDNGHVCIN